MSINQNDNISTIRTASRMLDYFFRRGHKEGREIHLRDLFKRRALVKKSKGFITTRSLFQSFFISTTPFVRLKMVRRRGRRRKRPYVKIAPLSRDRGERSSFVSLSNVLKLSDTKAKCFIDRLESELENVAIKAVSSKFRSKDQSTLCENRNEVHKLAFYALPRR